MFKLKSIKSNFLSFSRSQKIFIISIIASVFFISAEYGITRPASTSIFVSNFTSRLFPYCWILAVPVNLLIVYLYNRFLPKLGCLKTFFAFVISIIFVNSTTALLVKKYPFLAFIQFIFKDVYILLAFKQAWSIIHSTIDTNKAKYLYGVMFGMGGMGSVLGGLVSGFSAVKMGSVNLFYFSCPLYLLIFFFYYTAYKNSSISKGKFQDLLFSENSNPKEGFSLIRKSSFLLFILLIVIFMQVSTALLDYQFNFFLEKNIPNMDLRTQYTGRLTSLINFLSTAFQFFGGFVLVHFLGLKRAHKLVPMLLGVNSFAFLLFPSFGMATYAFATIKSLDYSLFGIIREMLYIPLKLDEKYRAKAIIDVFAYRSAKAFASLFLIFIQNITGLNIILLISVMSTIIYLFWIKIVSLMFKKQEVQKPI